MWRPLLTSAATGFVLWLLAANAAAAPLPTGNLLRNPGAEDAPGAAGLEWVPVPSWGATGTAGTAVQYGASGFPGPDVSARIGGGRNFFAGGPFRDNTHLAQDVDVSAWAEQIDDMRVKMSVSAFLGGYAEQNDHSTVLAYAPDAAGYAQALGPKASERGGTTNLLLQHSVTAGSALGPRVRTIRVDVAFYFGFGDYNDGYADNLTLRLLPIAPTRKPKLPIARDCAANKLSESVTTSLPLRRVDFKLGKRTKTDRRKPFIATFKRVADSTSGKATAVMHRRSGKTQTKRANIPACPVPTP